MYEVELDDSLNVRTMASVFNSVIKKADYTDDITVRFAEDCSIDLAGFQVLVSMKKELEKNGKSLIVLGLDNSNLLEYLK